MARPTHAERMADIRKKHDAELKRIRDIHAARIRQTEQVVAESKEEITLMRQLQDERDRVEAELDDDYTLRSRQAWRRNRFELGLPLNSQQTEEAQVEEVEGNRLHVNDSDVVALRAWLDRVCADEKITRNAYLSPLIRQGKAVRSQRRIWVPPVQSVETGLIVAHEVGHVLGEHDPAWRSVSGDLGIGTICPMGECAAWRWAMTWAPRWTEVEHTFMARCLNTYRGSAIGDEVREIDWLTTPTSGMREARLLRAMAWTPSR